LIYRRIFRRRLGELRQPLHMLRRPALVLVSLLASTTSAHASDPVVIVSPVDGAVVAPQFTAKVTFGDVTICHFVASSEECTDAPAELVYLFANGQQVGACDPCDGEQATFEVTLTPGAYDLLAKAQHQYAFEYSEVVKIEVEPDSSTSTSQGTTATPSTGAEDGTAGGSTEPGPNETDGTTAESATTDGKSVAESCTCGTSGGGLAPAAWLVLALLLTLRPTR
jgi:hypothetical protein